MARQSAPLLRPAEASVSLAASAFGSGIVGTELSELLDDVPHHLELGEAPAAIVMPHTSRPHIVSLV